MSNSFLNYVSLPKSKEIENHSFHFPFFQTMESQCWKAKEIWYEKCREVSKPINMMCWSCVVSHPYSGNNIFYWTIKHVLTLLSCSGRCCAQVWHPGSGKTDWGLKLSSTWPCFLIFPHVFSLLKVMEKSCEPQTEQMCTPPKKQPTQEKVHQVSIWKEICLSHVVSLKALSTFIL